MADFLVLQNKSNTTVFFCFAFDQKMPLGKPTFLIHYFLKTKLFSKQGLTAPSSKSKFESMHAALVHPGIYTILNYPNYSYNKYVKIEFARTFIIQNYGRWLLKPQNKI